MDLRDHGGVDGAIWSTAAPHVTVGFPTFDPNTGSDPVSSKSVRHARQKQRPRAKFGALALTSRRPHLPCGMPTLNLLPVMSDPVIRARNLSKTVQSGDAPLTILDGVSFEVGSGATVAVVGASGSGKTTLLGLLAGLDRPSAGEVWLGNMAL